MTKIVRSKDRIKQTGEVFTPLPLVDEILEKFPDEVWIPTKTFLDPSCGNGNFLVRVISYKIWLESTPEQALSTTYGVDLMQDNIDECKNRVLLYAFIASSDELMSHLTHDDEVRLMQDDNFMQFKMKYQSIVDRTIVCHDALTYDYEFKAV